MAKGQFWDDTFEKLAELGTSTVKKSGKSVKQTFNPLQIFEAPSEQSAEQKKQMEKLKKKDHTPLDFQKLQETYQDQDEKKTAELRNRLFQLVKKGEEEELVKRKREREQQGQQELQEKEAKKKKEEEQKKLQEQSETPRGKERKSILAPKKRVVRESQAEFKPSGTKN